MTANISISNLLREEKGGFNSRSIIQRYIQKYVMLQTHASGSFQTSPFQNTLIGNELQKYLN